MGVNYRLLLLNCKTSFFFRVPAEPFASSLTQNYRKSKKSSSLWQIQFISPKEPPFLAIFVPLEIYAPCWLNFKLKTIFYLQFVFVDTALPKVSRANFKFD